MPRWSRPIAILAAVLAAGTVAADRDVKGKKPRVELRASPRMGFSPVNVLVTAELAGGDDIEEYYCPEIEWDWDDGGKSLHEADCAPFENGTHIERRFTAEHEYRKAGIYSVKATFRHAQKSFASNLVKVTVRQGIGDNTRPDDQ